MTLFGHELRQGRTSLGVWTLCIGFFVLVCVMMYPEFEGQMEEVGAMFASMGGFTAAFGMDRLNIGTLSVSPMELFHPFLICCVKVKSVPVV